MRVSLKKKRWKNFRSNKKAYYSLLVFLFLFIGSLFSEFIANDKPILIIYKGSYYFPILKFYPETEFGGDLKTEAYYKDIEIQCLIISSGNSDCWDYPKKIIQNSDERKFSDENKGTIIWPFIKYSYDTISDDGIPVPSPPDEKHFLGTDDTARDVLARVIYGFRTSVLFGLIVSFFATIIGICAGAIQGYFGGRIDLIFQRLIEIWNSVPSIYVIIIISAFLNVDFYILAILMTLFSWTALVGVVRAEFLRVRNFDYVLAAKSIGVSSFSIMYRHLLPNAMVASLTLIPFIITGSIGSLAALDYLGFGLPASSPSLGELTLQARQNIQAPWLGICAFFVFSIMLALLVFI